MSATWIPAGVTALSVALTGGLVYLYHEQRKLNALEYTADVQAEGHRPSDDGRDLDYLLSRGMTYDEYERRKASDASADPFESLVVHRPQLADGIRTSERNERQGE